jgi:hypothetical protein
VYVVESKDAVNVPAVDAFMFVIAPTTARLPESLVEELIGLWTMLADKVDKVCLVVLCAGKRAQVAVPASVRVWCNVTHLSHWGRLDKGDALENDRELKLFLRTNVPWCSFCE